MSRRHGRRMPERPPSAARRRDRRSPIVQVRGARRRHPGESRHVGAGDVGELLPALEREQPAVGADGAQQPERERAGADARLDDRRAGEDVGLREDLRGILRVDDRGAARHRHHEVGQQRPQREVGPAVGGLDDGAVGLPDQHVVGEDAAVRVELLARFERDRVDAALGTGQLHAVAGDERTGRRGGALTVPLRRGRRGPRRGRRRCALEAVPERVRGARRATATCIGTPIVAIPRRRPRRRRTPSPRWRRCAGSTPSSSAARR